MITGRWCVIIYVELWKNVPLGGLINVCNKKRLYLQTHTHAYIYIYIYYSTVRQRFLDLSPTL